MLTTASLGSHHVRAQVTARPRHLPLLAAPRTGASTLAGVAIHVPTTYTPDRPAALLVMLHGAGGHPDDALAIARPLAEPLHAIIVAPRSHRATWDVIGPGATFGPDVAALDAVLSAVFDAYAIDPDRIAIGGFSDGASYALTLGLTNGTLFQTILAFSPGFEAARHRSGAPRIFISHGTDDGVLPVTSARRLARDLHADHLEVDYAEFAGGHSIPPDMLDRGVSHWLRP